MNYLTRLERMIRRLRVRQCPNPFVIFFQERTGSTLLCALLDSHPDIVCRREDFHEIKSHRVDPHSPVNPTTPIDGFLPQLSGFRGKVTCPTRKQILGHLYDIYSCQAKACGFKFKFPIQHKLFPDVLEELRHLASRTRFITLSRKNPLKQAVSRQNMLRIQSALGPGFANLNSDFTEIEKQKIQQQSFEVDIEAAISYAGQLLKQNRNARKVVSDLLPEGTERLDISYEDLLYRQTETSKQVLRFLGVDDQIPLNAEVRKATSDRLSEIIENYQELVEEVSKTELGVFLEDSTLVV